MMQMMIRTGSMPTAWIMPCICTCRAESPAPPEVRPAVGVAVSLWAMSPLYPDGGPSGQAATASVATPAASRDVLLRDRRAADLALDVTLAHDQHAVAGADDLRHLARDHDHP